MWKTIGRGVIARLTSQGWAANIVIGVAFLFFSPIIGKQMQSPRATIIGSAIGATILVWVVAWAAYRSVPGAGDKNHAQGLTSGALSARPAAPDSPPQEVAVNGSPGSTVFQAGRDIVVGREPRAQAQTIRSLTLEVRLTCVVKENHGDLPPDEVPFLPVGDANAYLEGPGGRQRLTFSSPVRFRRLADNRIVVVNRFAIDAAGDLINQPVSVLWNYETVVTPVVTIVWANEFARFTLLELSMSLNGADPAYYSWTYNDRFQERAGAPVFRVPFASIQRGLLGGTG